MSTIAMINAFACALNVGIYAGTHSPVNLGCAVFSGCLFLFCAACSLVFER